MSVFRLTITRADGQPVHLKPGARGERDLVAAIVAQTTGVGMFRTEAQVKAAVQRACEQVLRELKSEVMPT